MEKFYIHIHHDRKSFKVEASADKYHIVLLISYSYPLSLSTAWASSYGKEKTAVGLWEKKAITMNQKFHIILWKEAQINRKKTLKIRRRQMRDSINYDILQFFYVETDGKGKIK